MLEGVCQRPDLRRTSPSLEYIQISQLVIDSPGICNRSYCVPENLTDNVGAGPRNGGATRGVGRNACALTTRAGIALKLKESEMKSCGVCI